MALNIGTTDATSGMTKAIYDQLQASLEDGLSDLDAAALEAVRGGWRKLAHAVATGVVNHLLSNLEIKDVETTGKVTAFHANMTFEQTNDGTGLIA